MLEQRVERLERTMDEHEKRLNKVEQTLAAGDVRFQEIRRDLEEVKATIRTLTTWTQTTAITVGLGIIAALAAWLAGR
jgi:sugar-specific transcriptional regulator TrmB